MGSVLCPSQESPPVSYSQRIRSALPHGKAFHGCATPLLPPLRTAVRQCTGRRAQAAGKAALRVRDLTPAHWSLCVPPAGQPGGVWLPRRASGISAGRLLSRAAAPAWWPIGRTGRAGRWLRRPIAGCSGQALLSRAGHSIDTAAPVPLCLNKERNPAEQHALCDWCSTPVRTAAEGPGRPCSGCCAGSGGLGRSQHGWRATPPGPAGRP